MKSTNYLTDDMQTLANKIDHTILAPSTLKSDIDRICKEAITYNFASACIPPLMVKHAKAQLANTQVKVATVIGFPFGYSAVEAKLAETLLAIVDGADELDMVINYAAIKNNDWAFLANEINHIAPFVLKQNKTLKLIIESGILTDEEIIKCCQLYAPSGVQFLKTSTGYAAKGASVHAVSLMRQHLPAHVQIKASGGIKTTAFAQELVAAGADRLGCSSSLEIIGATTNNADSGY